MTQKIGCLAATKSMATCGNPRNAKFIHVALWWHQADFLEHRKSNWYPRAKTVLRTAHEFSATTYQRFLSYTRLGLSWTDALSTYDTAGPQLNTSEAKLNETNGKYIKGRPWRIYSSTRLPICSACGGFIYMENPLTAPWSHCKFFKNCEVRNT